MNIPKQRQVPPDNPLLATSGKFATALKALIQINIREISYLTTARVEHTQLLQYKY
jgi:hypothetical protein